MRRMTTLITEHMSYMGNIMRALKRNDLPDEDKYALKLALALWIERRVKYQDVHEDMINFRRAINSQFKIATKEEGADDENRKGARWTAGEIETLRRLYPQGTYDELRAQLPGRSRSAISDKARQIGLKKINSR